MNDCSCFTYFLVPAAFSTTYNTLIWGYFDKDDKNSYENILCLKYIVLEIYSA